MGMDTSIILPAPRISLGVIMKGANHNMNNKVLINK